MRVSNAGRLDFDKLVKIEGRLWGSKSTGCMCNLPIKEMGVVVCPVRPC